MNLYIYSYNNYYNRMVKKAGDKIEDYGQAHYEVESVFGYTPGDGVNTTQLLGTNDNNYDGKGDYMIVYDPFKDEIVSRWFILDVNRTRTGQWQLTLHRDLIVDFQGQIMNAPMYVEKATLSDLDPFIFNSENLSLNQIKTNEYLIKDKTGCAWIVGYLSRGSEVEGTLEDYSNQPFGPYTMNISNTLYNEEMTSEEFSTFVSDANRFSTATGYQLNFTIEFRNIGEPYYINYFIDSDAMKWESRSYENGVGYMAQSSMQVSTNIYKKVLLDLQELSLSTNSQLLAIAKQSLPFYTTAPSSKLNQYLSYNGKVIKVLKSDGVTYSYYKLKVSGEKGTSVSASINQNKGTINGIAALPTYMTQLVQQSVSGLGYFTGTMTGKIVEIPTYIKMTFEEVSSFDIEYTIPGTRRHLQDAPYDMFCIPYKEGGADIIVQTTSDFDPDVYKTIGAIETLSFAQQLAEKLGKNLLDLQLLPFCPLQGLLVNSVNDAISFSKGTYVSTKDYTFDTIETDNRVLAVFYATQSSNTINYEQLSLYNTEDGEKIADLSQLPLTNTVKMSNQCDMYRLCSPNWNGQFDFNPAKCGLDEFYKFNVDYTYLPYSPYIHINPGFSQLYGKDFNDARGLICQGDFSISYMSDAWVNYQVLNKNFNNVFDRQKKNLEVSQDVQRKQQVFNAVTGTIMGAAGGAAMGGKASAGGAIAGAAIGATLGAIGGALDVQYGDILRDEAKSYQQDMYNYGLDNIQALPDSIAKVTAYNYNNKIFPILEYYTCTDMEKQALANKIAYNGMTTMRIGKLNDFVNNNWSYSDDITSQGYIKGQLIRLELPHNHEQDIHAEDFHIINAIAGELSKGVFIKN